MRLALALCAALVFAPLAHAASVTPPITTGAKTGGISPQNGNYTGPTPAQANIAYTGTTGTFSGNPAVGDTLVGLCENTGGAGTPTFTSGWISITSWLFSHTGSNFYGAVGYHVVGVGEGATFTPCTNSPAPTLVGGIVDINLSGTWASHFQAAPVADANSQGPVSNNATASADNTLALSFSFQETGGAAIYTAPTVTGPTSGAVTSSPLPQITVSYGSVRYSGSAINATVQGNWTGGAGGSHVMNVMVQLGP